LATKAAVALTFSAVEMPKRNDLLSMAGRENGWWAVLDSNQ
jgi:hypothetical protein